MISPVADVSAAAEASSGCAYGRPGHEIELSAVRVRGRGGQGGGGGGGGGSSGGGAVRAASAAVLSTLDHGVTDFGKRGSEAFYFPDLPLQIKSCPSQRFYLHVSSLSGRETTVERYLLRKKKKHRNSVRLKRPAIRSVVR